jgi:hypothetical protein
MLAAGCIIEQLPITSLDKMVWQLNQLVGLAGRPVWIKGNSSVVVQHSNSLGGLAHGWSPDETRHHAGPTTQSPDDTLVGARAATDSEAPRAASNAWDEREVQSFLGGG